ncbi:MAG TPA: glycosyltransferase family 2 protein [Candidatus Dormibacteraeota bacterium]|jgi:glycosyltransferase involved in cell wall biosynthesis|nr:glycosyltransferase family 2 protein [Candidatus Dormibacteraeota bacterium]
MTARLPDLSLVLPAHNEVENIRWLLPHLATTLPALAERYEVVLVDDGSTDGTADTATALAVDLGMDLRIVRHEVKSGYGATVGDGLRATRLSYVAFTDADGQFEVADFALLLPLLDNADLVGGWREERSDAAMRSVVSWVFNTLVLVLYRLPYRDIDCAMKVMRREVLDSMELRARSALINTELYYKARHAGWRIAQHPVPHHPRRAGRRSGARPRAIARAIKELVVFRWTMRRSLPRTR